MDMKSVIQAGIDYIEENLRSEIGAHELARNAGFSLYHYYRLFQAATGFPVMQFILRRRLLHAAYKISLGAQGVDTALEYGFDTYAGFYRAFRREYGMTVSQYIDMGFAKRPRKYSIITEEHMEISKKKAAQILTNWQLSHLDISDFYYEGTRNRNENACYVGQEYVLKYTVNLGRMKANIALAKAMDEVGMHCAAVIPTQNGEDYVQDGEIYFCLTRRLPGKQMTSASLVDQCDAENGRLVGELLGQLHKALIKMGAPVEEPDLLKTLKEWAIPQSSAILGLEDEFGMEMLGKMEKLLPILPRQLIHRDPNPGNIIGNGKQWGFIDFELAEKNIRIFDPVYASTAVLSEIYDPKHPEICEKWLKVYQNIACGYDSVSALSEAEKQAYPYVLLANQMICVAWFSGQDKYPEAFERNKGMTHWLIRNFSRLGIE